jgi:hypothetical protein
MDKPLLKTSKQRVAEVLRLFSEGLHCWYQAGVLVVELIDNNEGGVELLKKESNGMVTDRWIALFERIGRHQLLPQLAYATDPGMERLGKMPFSLQEKYLDEPVELLILKDDDTTDKLKISMHDLTARQAAQVFDKDCVRSLSAQRAWLENERERRFAEAKPVPDFPYRINGRRVTFTENCTLTAKEIARILSEIERETRRRNTDSRFPTSRRKAARCQQTSNEPRTQRTGCRNERTRCHRQSGRRWHRV